MPAKRTSLHNHGHCVADALKGAATICSERGLNLTPTRLRVLELVWAGHEPVKAYDIIEKFSKGRHPAKPPTVYRALDFLLENGFIHRIESKNAFIGCPRPIVKHEGKFFICEACNRVIEIDSRRINATVEELAAENNFQVHSKTIEIYGLCAVCAGKKN
jgi:Fur family transcriptional regulator, zinc uptake regulator